MDKLRTRTGDALALSPSLLPLLLLLIRDGFSDSLTLLALLLIGVEDMTGIFALLLLLLLLLLVKAAGLPATAALLP